MTIVTLQCNGRPWVHPRHDHDFGADELVEYLRCRVSLTPLPRVAIKLDGHRCTAAALGLRLQEGPLDGCDSLKAGCVHVDGHQARGLLMAPGVTNASGGELGDGAEVVGSVTAQCVAAGLWLVSALVAADADGSASVVAGRDSFAWARMLCAGDDVGAAVSASLRDALARSSRIDRDTLTVVGQDQMGGGGSGDDAGGFSQQVLRVASAALVYTA